MSRPTVICLTPIKNEAWILERFLRCASLWADHIIVLDQLSKDESTDIAKQFPKVTLLHNPSPIYNEQERQHLLLEAARQIPGPRLLIALDADEFLTANFVTSPEWQTVLAASPGTVIRFKWENIQPDLQRYWTSPYEYAWGFMDDGSDHSGAVIHSSRIPVPWNAPTILLRDVKVMHWQFVDTDRHKSKTRWYKCWERLNRPQRSAIEVHRQYHRTDYVPPQDIHPIPEHWFAGYLAEGIDMTSIRRSQGYWWWDQEVLDLLDKHGERVFARLDIWYYDWAELHRQLYPKAEPLTLADPRTSFEKFVHRFLQKSQPRANTRIVRLVEALLRRFSW
jgi:hypothetical protein